jgi:hypothetical protein
MEGELESGVFMNNLQRLAIGVIKGDVDGVSVTRLRGVCLLEHPPYDQSNDVAVSSRYDDWSGRIVDWQNALREALDEVRRLESETTPR